MPQLWWPWLALLGGLLLGLGGALAWYFQRWPAQLRRLRRHLQESENRYRRLVQTADVGIAVLDADLHIVEWNPLLEQLFDLPRSQALGADFTTACLFPEDRPRVVQELKQQAQADQVFELEFPLRLPQHERRLWRWRVRYFLDPRDGRAYLTAVGHDVTELRTATFRLMASEARFRQVFQAAPVGMALADPDGRLLTANQEYARFLGFTATDELVGKHLLDFCLPEDHDDMQQVLRTVARDGASGYRLEKRFVTAQSKARWGQARGVGLEDEYGQRYLISQIADIHERKKAELALMESERRLATLISNLSGAVYRYEAPAFSEFTLHHDLSLGYISDGVEALTGYPRSVFLRAQTVLELSHLLLAEDRPALEQALREALSNGGSFHAVYRLRHAVSGLRWVSEQGRIWHRPDGTVTIDGLILDITNERQARESELVYRTLVADTETGFVCLSPLGVVLEANLPYMAMAGLEHMPELIGRSLLSWTAPEFIQATQEFLAQTLEQGHARHFETEYLRGNGSRVHLLINAVATPGGGGERVIKCLLFDISRSKAVQRELTEHRNQLSVAQRFARLGAWQWSFENHEILMSDVFLELIEHPPGAEPPTVVDLQGLLEPADMPAVRRALAKLVADGEHAMLEFRIRLMDDRIRYCRADATLDRSQSGRRLRLLGTVQDITESKAAEAALRESEARYRSLFDTNIDGIFFISLSHIIEEGNAAFLNIIGFDEDAVRGLSCDDITPEAWREADTLAWAQIAERGWCDTFTKEYRCRDGRLVPVSVRAWLVRDETGEPVRVMSMVRDITELKKMEAEREQLQKGMQQAQKMEAIGQLTGGIAHDFNNILASILGYTDLALRREAVQQDARLGRHLQEVRMAGERARELISQMLLFSRGGRNTGSVQNISTYVQEAVRMLRPTLPATLRLRTFISLTLPPVRAEAVSIQQVVMNLVINARDAMEGRGEVQVIARLSELQPMRCASCNQMLQGQFLELAVRDHGPGIAPAVRERIFDPFFSTKAVGQGTGMGLPVVHGIVHDFGGHLLLDSGSWGTTFRILLPIPMEAAVVPVALPERQRELGQGEQILVVDDEVPVAHMLGELLESHGYRVQVLTDSVAALEYLRSGQRTIDLLLSDYVMPGLDGIELVRQARALQPDLPVVMLSGQAMILPRDELSWPVLHKPVDVPALLACLSNLLDSRRMMREADLV